MMKNKDVIEKILAYHPDLPGYEGCDGYKCGDPEGECTGVAVALVPTADVIERAAAAGCNLIVTHEPIFYQTPDFDNGWMGWFKNKIYDEKQEIIKRTGMTVWRDHDHMHANRPDSIFHGVIKELGWLDYLLPEQDYPFNYVFKLPQTTIAELGKYLSGKLGLNGLKFMGNPDAKISKVALVGHLCPGTFMEEGINKDGYYEDYAMHIMEMMEDGVEVIIPGEIIEWTVLAYIRDAIHMGKVKGCLNIGHFNLEELGMKDFAEVIQGLVGDEIKSVYVPTEDGFSFM